MAGATIDSSKFSSPIEDGTVNVSPHAKAKIGHCEPQSNRFPRTF
jgi:hypothetical protein